MHNKLVGWINGVARQVIGGYWGSQGICLVYQLPDKDPIVVYVPVIKEIESSAWEEAIIKLESLCGPSRRQMALSIALSADDVFVRAISVPEGLDDGQLEQVAIVEAVANLPVPPEEICLDFIREKEDGQGELIRISFCKRERIDEIVACAEEIEIPVHVVDRDTQAIHDAIAARVATEGKKIKYPIAIVLTEISPRIVVALGVTDFETYPIRLQPNASEEVPAGFVEHLRNCWVRCRMNRINVAEVLEDVFVIGRAIESNGWQAINANADVFKAIRPLKIDHSLEMGTGNMYVPDEIFLTALGMSARQLA